MTSRGPRSVLIVCDVVPGHRAAGEVRLAHMAMLLAEQDRVALVALDRHLDEPDDVRADALRAGGVEVLGASGPTALRAGLAKRPYDLVVIEFWHIAERVLPLLRAKQPWAVVAVDSVDLHFLREERGESVGHVSPAGMEDRKRRELVAYGAADVRIFTSDAERERYQAEGGNAEGNLIVSIIAPATARLPRPRRPLVVFVGCFWHAPNLDGVTWFAERVWPVVRASVPDATFAVAGSRVGPEVSRLGDRERGIDVLGFVPDIGSLYDEASVAVAPLRFGAG